MQILNNAKLKNAKCKIEKTRSIANAALRVFS